MIQLKIRLKLLNDVRKSRTHSLLQRTPTPLPPLPAYFELENFSRFLDYKHPTRLAEQKLDMKSCFVKMTAISKLSNFFDIPCTAISFVFNFCLSGTVEIRGWKIPLPCYTIIFFKHEVFQVVVMVTRLFYSFNIFAYKNTLKLTLSIRNI